MRVVIQRVLEARVDVDNQTVGKIGKGLLIFLSVGKDDNEKDGEFIAGKLVNLRVFEDEQGKMNLSIQDVGGQMLLISNFTLHGNCQKGRRPSFDSAGDPQKANSLYEKVIKMVSAEGIKVEKGIFAAHMHVHCVNDGPVTFILDSK